MECVHVDLLLEHKVKMCHRLHVECVHVDLLLEHKVKMCHRLRVQDSDYGCR